MHKGIMAARRLEALNQMMEDVHRLAEMGMVDQEEINALSALQRKRGEVWELHRLEALASIFGGIRASMAARPSLSAILETPGLSKTSTEALKKTWGD